MSIKTINHLFYTNGSDEFDDCFVIYDVEITAPSEYCDKTKEFAGVFDGFYAFAKKDYDTIQSKLSDYEWEDVLHPEDGVEITWKVQKAIAFTGEAPNFYPRDYNLKLVDYEQIITERMGDAIPVYFDDKDKTKAVRFHCELENRSHKRSLELLEHYNFPLPSHTRVYDYLVPVDSTFELMMARILRDAAERIWADPTNEGKDSISVSYQAVTYRDLVA